MGGESATSFFLFRWPVEQMLDLHKQLAAAKIPDAKTRIQRQIDATDKQIDQLIYALYGLTEEEIKIVEERATR